MRKLVVVAIASLASLTGGVAHAIPYETFIDVDDEASLQDLLASQDISQETFDQLLDLLDRGVELNEAGRAELYALPNLTYEDVDKIIAFRELQNGYIKDPADLVASEVITQEKLFSIASFLVVRARKAGFKPKGWVRVMTRMSLKDHVLPPIALRGRFTADKHWTAGFGATFSRLQIGDPTYDPNRDALVADPAGYQVHLPKLFVKYEDDAISAIAGTFRAGFGQRLVFDNSLDYTPNGLYLDDQIYYSADLTSDCRFSAGELDTSPCDGPAGNQYVTPDWNFRQGLLGAGIGAKRLDVGSGWLQLYGWGSISRRDIYQYELFDAGKCKDPHDDGDLACAAPDVYVRPAGDPLAPTARFSFTTLPNVFSERLAGMNASYFADRRNSIGLTAYVANEANLIEGITLDTQEWSRLPTGRTFGAGGANFNFGKGAIDLGGEVALSGDKMPDSMTADHGPAHGGGGVAGILRMTATRKKEELEATLRYYSIDYANPFARPIAQSDEFEGQRARDELGARLRYVRSSKTFNLRAQLDVWVPPSTFDNPTNAPELHTTPKLDTYVRADVRTTDEVRLGLSLRYQDKDLQGGGHDQCYEIASATTTDGLTIPCSGRQLTTIARGTYTVDRTLAFTLQLEHQLLDDNVLDPSAFRTDVAAWFITQWRPVKELSVRARVRYLDEAFNDKRPGKDPDSYLERSVSSVVDAGYKLRKSDEARFRIDVKDYLDHRASSLMRDPNPEVTFWLTYEAHL
ncbi:MAG: hypothetical protein NT062_03455 [Proteobacteria bacterium]|nr:hypothetical protein [Pseudomonadota bacterium]